MSSDSKDRRRPDIRLPLAGAAFTLAGKAGEGASNALLWKATNFGVAGTGKRIAELSGAVRMRAALASIGKGPLINGGRGMAGGQATLSKVETAVAVTLGAAYLGAVVAANWDQFKGQPAAEAKMVCKVCGGAVEVSAPESQCTHHEGGAGEG